MHPAEHTRVAEPRVPSRSALRALGATFARRLFLDRQAEFWLAEINARWSLGEARGRVVEVIAETHDVKTFVLKPNARFRSHRAGQHATLELEIGGVRVRRCYSLTSTPGSGLVSFTVKRVPGGLVSNHLHDHLRRGDVLGLGQPAGDFVLPAPTPARLLLLSGGSGITPVMAMLRELAARGSIGDVVFVHCARTPADVIFARELARLAREHRALRVLVHTDDDAREPGPMHESKLRALVPDFAERETFLCGPPPMMAAMERVWERADATARLRRERFVAAPVVAPAGDSAEHQIALTRSSRTLRVVGEGTLLERLERAGERPESGCRMGICQTCKCRKASGAVLDLRTGVVSDRPDEDIQLCVSVPRSDLELEL